MGVLVVALLGAGPDTESILDEIEEGGPESIRGGADPFTEVNGRLADYGLSACAGG